MISEIGRSSLEVTPIGCYVSGCGAMFTFPSLEIYRRRVAELEASEASRAWTGGKRFTEPELLPDGHVAVGLVLYRPD